MCMPMPNVDRDSELFGYPSLPFEEDDDVEYRLTDYGRQVAEEIRSAEGLDLSYLRSWTDDLRPEDVGRTTFDPDDPQQAFRAIFDEAYDLMLRKQRDYGNGNIETFGTAGVLVRLADKFARLRNLTSKGQEPATDESLEDTWLDIINYGLIGLCLQRGWVYHPQTDYVLKERR